MRFPRSARSDRPIALLLFALIAAVAIGAKPWSGETSTPLDLLASYPGWGRMVDGGSVIHPERSDALDFFLPQWTYARHRLREGDLPLWNDTRAGGDVSLLNPVIGQLTPAFAIFASAPSPATGFYLAIWFNLTFAGFGMFLFLRRHLGMLPAVFGGILFQLCGFSVAWLYWAQALTLMWAPWLLCATDGLVARRSPGGLAAVGVATALLLLGGFPFVAELVMGSTLLYALLLSFRKEVGGKAIASAWRRMVLDGGTVTCGMIVGIVLAFLPLATFSDWLSQFSLAHRGGGSSLRLAESYRFLLAPWAFEAPRVEVSMYVGSLGAILAVLGFLCTGFRRKAAGPLGPYGLLLAAIAAILTFQLVPVRLLAWVPGLDMNMWSRAISILDLALAISAAVLLQKLLSFARDREKRGVSGVLVCGAVVCLVSIQIFDQVRYYRKFNGKSDSSHFYPRTDILSHVMLEKGPFDYAVADNSFIVSGSLGGYGIREWFAHRFKSAELLALLPHLAVDPFATPTASTLDAASILSEAPEMAAMNVRYLLLRSDYDPTTAKITGLPGSDGMQPLPPLPWSLWQQPILIEAPVRARTLAIRFATYTATDVDGRLALDIAREDGSRVVRVEQDASLVKDNDYYDFRLPDGVDLPRGMYQLSITYAPGPNRRPLTAWAGRQPEQRMAAVVNGEATDQAIDYVLYLHADGNHFRKVMDDGLVSLWENLGSPNGPYFVESLDTPFERNVESVRVSGYRPESFAIDYSGSDAGYVVVPMEATRDWSVSVDGKDAEYERLFGVLPAVKVSAPARLRFEYRPAVLRWTWPWLALVIAVLGGLAAWSRQRGNPARR